MGPQAMVKALSMRRWLGALHWAAWRLTAAITTVCFSMLYKGFLH